MSTNQKMQLPASKPAKARKAQVVAKAASKQSAAPAAPARKPVKSPAKKAVTTLPKTVKFDAAAAATAAGSAPTSKAIKQPTAKPTAAEKSSSASTNALTPATGKAAKAAPEKPAKESKHKQKLVRDSFTMPREEFDLIHALKERALDFKRPTKKSELLRAGLRALAALDDTGLRERLDALTALSPGRPKKHR